MKMFLSNFEIDIILIIVYILSIELLSIELIMC